MLATVLLASTLAVTVTNSGSVSAQFLQPQQNACVEVRGVDGPPLWFLCSGVYLDDTSELERDAQATADHRRADQQGISRWTYRPGHPGFESGNSSDISRWVASPIHEGFTYPGDTY